MNIQGLSKAKVLQALFNSSRRQGMGFLDQRGASCMSDEQAEQIVNSGHLYFDYLFGRVMKIDISGDEIETRLYDRDNGEGAAERAIQPLKDQDQ